MIEKPEGIMLTISGVYLKERGIEVWLKDFLYAMEHFHTHTYWVRLGSRPKQEVLYIYLVIGNRVKYRYNFVMYDGPGDFHASDGRVLYARCWMVGVGPLVRAGEVIERRGFQGFRYTEFIF